MRVLVLGATGFIGGHLVQRMGRQAGWSVIAASRNAASDGAQAGAHLGLALDTCDQGALEAALERCDAVVNLVAGSARSIHEGGRVLARALDTVSRREGRLLHWVQVSSMAVYQGQEGPVDESTPLRPASGWYARAKQTSEASARWLSARGHPVTVLRPGCVWGPGSHLWVGRIADWLQRGWLGDLGPWGDGWTHGVHVQDVCEALEQCLRMPPPPGQWRCRNLTAPDSPRWNTWFADLALAIDAPPLRHLSRSRLLAQAWLASPAILIARRLHRSGPWPDPMPPGLLALWASQMQMQTAMQVQVQVKAAPHPQDPSAAMALDLRWTPYRVSLAQGADWWRETRASRRARAMNSGLPMT